MKKVLITGATGFVGSHMIDYILANHPDYSIVAMKRRRSDMDNVRHVINHPRITWAVCNAEDYGSVQNVFQEHGPFDKIFHLAAQSFVKFSWDSPIETIHSNVDGTVNILEATRKMSPDAVVQIAGSSEEYGYQETFPLTEDLLLRPLSPYAVSKVAAENLGYQYFKSYGIKTILTRTFNHEGPRRGEVFVTSTFAKQVAEIEKGLVCPVIKHGNLDSYRDYTDVRDVVVAYWLATEKCIPGEPYNICSGNLTKIEDVLKTFMSLSPIEITAQEDPSRLRPSDLVKLCGSSEKFKKATGWEPKISVDTMLKDILEYWRGKV
jgi:GDP-4-dehydro-6-deoxy-D-mannose reductase